MNEVVPLYVPGNDITCAVAADAADDRYVQGGRFVAVAGDLDGALPVVGYPVQGEGPVFGVAARDSGHGQGKVPVVRGASVILPVAVSGPVSVGDLLEVGSRGVGVRRVAGYPVARAMQTGDGVAWKVLAELL